MRSVTARHEGRADEWTVDELAQRSGVPVRTIREYQTMGLLHPPRRVGRVGRYGISHLRRLQLIARLQERGYSLAGIGDLLAAWRGGSALTEILGLEPDQLVHVDEPGAAVTLEALAEILPSLVPDRLEELLATGLVERCAPDRLCMPSPSLVQLAADLARTGMSDDDVLGVLGSLLSAAESVADAVLRALAQVPGDADDTAVETLVGRGRGLLAHGVGRLALHRIGRRVSEPADGSDDETLGRLMAMWRPSGRQASP